MEVFISFLYFLALCAAVGVVAVYWRNHPGPVWLVYLVSLVGTIYVLDNHVSDFVGRIFVLPFMFLSFAMFGAAASMVLDDLGRFGRKLTSKESGYLHEHRDLGWHDHEYHGNHVHPGNNLNGPFHYVDERVIDQRRGR